MDQTALIEIAKQLVAIPSSGDNNAALHEALNFITELIQASGKDITIEPFESNGIPSLLAYRGSTRPDKFRIILNGHIDVIGGTPEQYQPKVVDGIFYGRGAYDMKIAAIVLTNLFCEFVDKVPYALGLQIVTDEEFAGIHGTQYQISQGVRGDFIICGDCGRSPGTYEIANRAKGICTFVVEFPGTSTHGAYPWRGQNPAIRAAHFAMKMQELYPTPNDETEETTVSLTSIISSGDSYSQTPGTATARFDTRYTIGDTNFGSKEGARKLVAQLDSDAKIIEFLAFSAPVNTSPTNPLLLDLKAAAEKIEKHAFTFVQRNGTSDGRHYGEVGDEACEFGVVGAGQHSDNEYVSVEAIDNYQKTMHHFLENTIQSEQGNFQGATG